MININEEKKYTLIYNKGRFNRSRGFFLYIIYIIYFDLEVGLCFDLECVLKKFRCLFKIFNFLLLNGSL